MSAGLPTSAAGSDLHAFIGGPGGVGTLYVDHNNPGTDYPADANDLTVDDITIDVVGPNFVITTTGPLRAGARCQKPNPDTQQVQCPSAGILYILLDAGGGDDVVKVRRSPPRRIYVSPIEFTLRANAGNDRVVGAPDAENMISGGDGNDYLEGGALADGITGKGGVDTIRALDGNDYVDNADGVRDNVASCGPGIDSLSLDFADPAPFIGPGRCERVRRQDPVR